MERTVLDTMKQDFSGEVILPGEAGYEQARATFFTRGDPAVVLRPRSPEDVAAAIQYARDNGLVISIRSGGHSFAGFSTNNGGLVIDLSGMGSIKVLAQDQGIVSIGPGATWGEVSSALQKYGLAISSGDTKSVGVGGLALGGGIGWMVRKYGLTIDSLTAAEVVTAEDKVLRASASEHPDLFWALRGGGGNFGVVTCFEFAAHRVGKVYEAKVTYDMADLVQVLKGWSEYARAATEDLTSSIVVMPPFFGNPPMVQSISIFAGDDETAAMRAIEPLLHLGQVVQQEVLAKDYPSVLEEGMKPPETLRIIDGNVFVERIGDELIQAIAGVCGKEGSPVAQFRSLGGAMNRVPSDATAFAHRSSEALLGSAIFLPSNAPESVASEAVKPWKRLAAFGRGAYGNFLSAAAREDVETMYPGETYKRLAQIKAIYDPDNVFNQNHNILPAV